jgi:hypothetical protein
VVGGSEGAQEGDLESSLDSKSVLSYCFRACEQSRYVILSQYYAFYTDYLFKYIGTSNHSEN